ncbi:fms-related tyrosine kinase 3 ligand [Falco rusticolus]|uniref:fms-related tyrosine kinase 3 ligand n=1 Tax=Falco rusticolus TaxID=120794 RepID=UPI0018868911|nr:fms-related tyrosine kinase 3 ligand [Falco rusticolus]
MWSLGGGRPTPPRARPLGSPRVRGSGAPGLGRWRGGGVGGSETFGPLGGGVGGRLPRAWVSHSASLSLSVAAPPQPRGGPGSPPPPLTTPPWTPPPPGSALVPLLLLLIAAPPGGCCSFDFNPVSSTFSSHVDALTSWLILDYPVAMPSNLAADSRCSDLWGLHFVGAALRHMVGVAGGELAPHLQAVAAHVAFVTECHIQDPQGCVQLETVNVTQLLGALVRHLGGLRGRPPHFPGCARLRCRPAPPLTTPVVQHERTLGSRSAPPPTPSTSGLVLLGGLGGALGLVATVWVLWRRPCAQPLQGTPMSEQDGT